MLDGAIILWFILTGLSLIYISYDLVYVTPEAAVMKWGWWLVVLYTGPVGLFFYLLSCKEPFPGSHEEFTAPLWKQSLGSMVHCLAGDVTGIILAAIILAIFPLLIAIEITLEYIAGFTFGLFIFQSLFMKDMMGGSYWKAVKGTFYPEWLSMNMIMTGMIPVMVIWAGIDPNSLNPLHIHFWARMSLASIVAGLTAFPINRWLVKHGLKHGMMTVRPHKEDSHSHHGHHEGHGEHGGHEHPAPTVSKGQKLWKMWLTLIFLAVGITIAIVGYQLVQK